MDFVSARQNMVESQVRTNDVTDVRIQDAMRALPRERFCLAARRALAYSDVPVEYAEGRFLLAPRDVGKLLQMLEPKPGERALVIGGPYAAALLARMGLRVTALEDPAADAHARLALEGESVEVVAGDLARPSGQWDLVLSEGAVAAAPEAWLQALVDRGRLGAIVRRGAAGKGTLYVRSGEAFGAREAFDAFAPFLPGFEPKPAFTF